MSFILTDRTGIFRALTLVGLVIGSLSAQTTSPEKLGAPPLLRIWLSEKQVASTQGGFPSADLLEELNKKCIGVTLTDNRDRADYRLEAGRAKCCDKKGQSKGYKFALFSKGGDAVFSTDTHELKNAVKDLCYAIGRSKK